VGVQMLIL